MSDEREKERVHIMYGLPGSGKTSICSIYMNKGDKYIDLDKYAMENESICKGKTFAEWTEDFLIKEMASPRKNFYIDGLVCTLDSLADLIHAVINAAKRPLVIVVYVWNENREACLYNDDRRRAVSSEATIRSHPYDPIESVQDIWKLVGNDYVGKAEFFLSRQVVCKKPRYKKWFEQKGITMYETFNPTSNTFASTDELCSRKYSCGGVMKTYTGNTFPVCAEEGVEFTELYDLLLALDENIPFRVVRRIEKELVEQKHTDESDYYGGSVTYLQFKINLEKLYELLREESM